MQQNHILNLYSSKYPKNSVYTNDKAAYRQCTIRYIPIVEIKFHYVTNPLIKQHCSIILRIKQIGLTSQNLVPNVECKTLVDTLVFAACIKIPRKLYEQISTYTIKFTFPSSSNPSSWLRSSISVRWISRSALVPSLNLRPPMASISSMKMMHG